MKKTILVWILPFFLLIGFGPLVTHVEAETMNFKLVSMYDKVERVKVAEAEGVMIGVMDRKA